MTKATLGPDSVDKIWHNFKGGDGSTCTASLAWASSRDRLTFGNWVWSQGGSLRRDHKKYYIDFRDDTHASFFLLRWS